MAQTTSSIWFPKSKRHKHTNENADHAQGPNLGGRGGSRRRLHGVSLPDGHQLRGQRYPCAWIDSSAGVPAAVHPRDVAWL